jgi:hypothetical protein
VIFRLSGIFSPVLVNCVNKNLATLHSHPQSVLLLLWSISSLGGQQNGRFEAAVKNPAKMTALIELCPVPRRKRSLVVVLGLTNVEHS